MGTLRCIRATARGERSETSRLARKAAAETGKACESGNGAWIKEKAARAKARAATSLLQALQRISVATEDGAPAEAEHDPKRETDDLTNDQPVKLRHHDRSGKAESGIQHQGVDVLRRVTSEEERSDDIEGERTAHHDERDERHPVSEGVAVLERLDLLQHVDNALHGLSP